MNNRVILILIIAVCVLGMALIMLNERMGQKNAAQPAAESAPAASMPAPGTPPELDKNSFAAPQPQDVPASTEPAQASTAQPALPLPGTQSKETSSGISTLPAHDLDSLQHTHGHASSLTPDKPVDVSSAALNQRLEEQSAAVTPSAAQRTGSADTEAGPAASPAVRPDIDAKIKAQEEARAAAAQKEQAREKEKAREKEQAQQASQAKPREEQKARQDIPAEPRITRFVVYARDKGATVRLEGAMPMSYKSIMLEDPQRMVIDLPGAWKVTAPGIPANPLVSNIRIGNLDGRTRLVIDLKQKPRKHRIILSKDKKRLDFRVDI